ncbi:MAG: PilZ domain-containing protein [Bacillota bacterium]
MKTFKRGEYFRYTFKTPHPGRFKLLINHGGKLSSTKEGSLHILDLSPRGMRFKTEYTLPADRLDFQLEIQFELSGVPIVVLGHPVWRKSAGKDLLYGFTSIEDAETEKLIIETLKAYSKKDT